MEKRVKIATDAAQKSIIQKAIESSENEQLDLYKAIFGGAAGSNCNVAAPINLLRGSDDAVAYDKTDQFLRAPL
ncbi:hypothetical protein FAM09_10760 [Niastella caeni]|uniref:Uncharacterized protein n=1 Tax=Niastella caeni TaxID=2569763 RepID=A0A4S8HXH4_9BACT|nr:hypothetical protein [Niastella caeni]THU40340.1 hypothetical protein FAM09_10760 [Niastella caeni]